MPLAANKSDPTGDGAAINDKALISLGSRPRSVLTPLPPPLSVAETRCLRAPAPQASWVFLHGQVGIVPWKFKPLNFKKFVEVTTPERNGAKP